MADRVEQRAEFEESEMNATKMALVGKKSAVLGEVALPVVLNDLTRPAILALAERMLATCRAKGGMAIAAPQVGVSQRLVVQWDGTAWINPILDLDEEETVEDVEGCLSIPGRVFLVRRFTRCAMTATGIDGITVTVGLEGLEARMAQHEVDHLDGVLISSRGMEVPNGGMSAVKL